MNHELHKKTVEEEKKLVDAAGKKIANGILSGMNVRLLLSPKFKQYIIMRAIKLSDSAFTQVSKLGHDFAEKKINDKLPALP